MKICYSRIGLYGDGNFLEGLSMFAHEIELYRGHLVVSCPPF